MHSPRQLYRVVMVPTDGSEASRQALPLALAIAKSSQSTLHVVAVMEPHLDVPIYGVPIAGGSLTAAHLADPARAQVSDASRQQNEQRSLEALASRVAADAGVDTRAKLAEGEVVDALRDYVRANAVDLIVMSTHGRSGIGRAVLGSVADALLRAVTCPLLLARPHGREVAEYTPASITHVLVPLDGSAESDTIVRHATEVAELTGARCTLLHVRHPEVLPGVTAPDALVDPEASLRDLEDAKNHLERFADLLRARSVRVSTVVLPPKNATAAIIEYAGTNAVDLIAMTTHARHGMARLMLGSTATSLMQATRLPLLLLRSDISSSQSQQPG